MSSVSSGSARNASSALRMSMRASSPTGRTNVDERPPRGRSMGGPPPPPPPPRRPPRRPMGDFGASRCGDEDARGGKAAGRRRAVGRDSFRWLCVSIRRRIIGVAVDRVASVDPRR